MSNNTSFMVSALSSIYVDIAAIVVLFILTSCCHKKRKKAKLFLILAGYLIIYAYFVFFSRKVATNPRLNLELFWSYRNAFDGVKYYDFSREIIQNILVFIPIGMLLTVIIPRHPVLLSVIMGVLLSMATETVQYFTRTGLAELDDVFSNCIGLILGILIMKLSQKVEKKCETNKKICNQ